MGLEGGAGAHPIHTHPGPTLPAGPSRVYPYTGHLKELERRKPGKKARAKALPAKWKRVCTPLVPQEWEELLQHHPDREYVGYLVKGLKQGFHVGFRYWDQTCTSAASNMKSADANPQVVDKYLAKEVELGRVLGPLGEGVSQQVHVNRFGVIPKNHQPGKWRLIVDLSHPEGGSVNDGIEPELCSLRYTSVDEAVRRVIRKGRGTELAKFDIESAYRTVPVHPDDRPLLGDEVERGDLY